MVDELERIEGLQRELERLDASYASGELTREQFARETARLAAQALAGVAAAAGAAGVDVAESPDLPAESPDLPADQSTGNGTSRV